MNKRSMRAHLTITFAIIALIPILILGSVQVSQITNITKEAKQSQEQMTYRLADAVDAYISYRQNAVETLAATISASDPPFRTRESLTLKLQSLQETLAGFSGLYVVDANALIKAMNTAANPSLIGLDVSQRDYTERIRATQKTVISPLFRDLEGANQPAVAIAVPILDANKRMDGFVLAVLDLVPVKAQAIKYEYGTGAYPVIVDQAGRPVYHPNETLTASLADLSQEPVLIDSASKPKGEGTYKLSSSSQEEFITYAAIADIGWTVWVSRSKEAVNGAFYESLQITVMLLVLTLLVTAALGSLLAKRLNRTIHTLVGYTQRLATGSFQQFDDAAIPREAPKELQILAEHFFRMATQIKENQHALMELNAELEKRVEERTQSLLRKNQELEIVNTLLLPSIQDRAAAQHIAEGLKQLRDFVQAAVYLRLAHAGSSTLGGIQDWESLVESREAARADSEMRVPVQTGSLVLGEMTVHTRGEKSGQEGGHKAFLHTFANTVAIILQNDLLLKSMQNEHATLNAVLESMSDAIVLIDVQHRVAYANHRMSDIFGIPMAALLSMSEQELFHTLSGLLVEQQTELHKLTQERSTQGIFTLAGHNGKERFLTVSAFEVSRENRVFGRGYVWRDMTKEHEIDALKNDLISLASHEFKTPITSIKGSVETLLRTDAHWEESFKQELMEGIHEDIGRIQDLIEEWLDISKIEAGAMRMNPEPLLLTDAVESARRRLPQQAAYVNTRFEIELGADLPPVYADKLRLEQVLINLFTNAVRYNSDQPLIRIRAKAMDDFVRLEIEDNGIGISEEHVEHIFDRFYRVDVSSIRQTGGTGLGLAICKGIMQAHGGDIEVTSELGHGSTFTLLIPKYQREEKG